MFRSLFKIGMAAALLALPLALAACTSGSDQSPFALTGPTNAAEMSERARWTDDKGHYRPEWREGINRPAGYPKSAVAQSGQ